MTASVALVGVFLVWFQARQKRGAIGGQLSTAKAFWLGFAVVYWFLLCPLLAATPAIGARYQTVLFVFSANMWVRGLLELTMMYRWKNWRPPYGITHDLFSLVLVVTFWIVAPESGGGVGAWPTVGEAAVLVLVASLVLETGYAIVFHGLVEGRTTGDDAVWFANKEDPRFRRVNAVTAACNVPLWGFVAFVVAAAWGVWL